MVRAAIAAAASPIQLQLEKLEEDYDEETVDAQAAQFTQAFIQFAAANPGAAGASAAAVLLIQALSLVAARMEEADDEDDDEGYDDDDDDDDIADYGDYETTLGGLDRGGAHNLDHRAVGVLPRCPFHV